MDPELAEKNVRFGWALFVLFAVLVAVFIGIALLFQ